MKIAILHHDLEYSEEEFQRQFEKRGVQTDLFDIRETSIERLLDYKPTVVMNRVYASVANRDWKSNLRTLDLLKNIEMNKIRCINSYFTTKADYSKFFAYQLMKEKGIPTPETYFLNNKSGINKALEFVLEHNFPIIIKRDMGGRGKDLIKVKNKKELLMELKNRFSREYLKNYDSGHILQQFVKSNRKHDARIVVIEGKVVFSYGRELISRNGGEPWLASYSLGSKITKYNSQEKEEETAKKATNSIGALFNEVDIMFTENGPVVIESNPTPQHTNTPRGKEEVIRVTKKILDSFKK